MSGIAKAKQLTEQQQLLFEKLCADRMESAKMLEKPSMEGIKETVVEKYSERAHFVYELLQNADDAKATKVRFIVSRNGLIFAHNGTVHFSISDVDTEGSDKDKSSLGHINAITSIAQTAKSESEIGKFGIGFKSVFQYSDTPEIFDPPFYFRIERFIVPIQLPSDHSERKRENNETLFFFPFNSLKKKPNDAYDEITARLKDLNHPLLFLKNLRRIEWKNEELHWNYSREETVKGNAKIISSVYREEARKYKTKFLVFEKIIPSPEKPQQRLKINIAFKISPKDDRKIDSTKKYSPFCFFETHEQSDLRFIIQAPFVLNNSREGLRERDPDNEYLIQNLASLLGESLPVIRDLGYLSIDFFEILPLPSRNGFLGSMRKYEPLFEIVLEKMRGNEKLLPTHGGGYTNAQNGIIARGGKDFVELLGNKQLEDLYTKKDLQWLDLGISEKNETLWTFCTEKEFLGIKDLRPEGFATSISKSFIERQSDEWLVKFYSFLLDTKYSDLLKGKPYIRISVPKTEGKDEEIDHVEPFDKKKKPQAFLPLEKSDERQFNDYFPVVKRTIIQNPRAKQFLEKIGLKSPDEFAAIRQVILPKYSKILVNVSDDVNRGEIEKIARFLKVKRNDINVKEELKELAEFMQSIPFLYAINCDEKSELKSPQSIYLPRQYSGNSNLDLFFERNPEIWFLDTRYQKVPEILQLIEFLEISSRPKIFTETFQDWHTYKKGFTHDYKMEGLDFLLNNQTLTLQKSLYLWQLLLESQKNPLYRIEFSGILEYANDSQYKGAKAGRKSKHTTIFELLTGSAWVPNKQAEFKSPSEVKELHQDFEYLSEESKDESEKLYQVLNFFSDSSSWLDRAQSIIPEGTLAKIKLANELPEEIIREVYEKFKDEQKNAQQKPELIRKHADPKKALREFFDQPQWKGSTEIPIGGNPVSNPERRREVTAEEIQQAHMTEPPVSERVSFSIVKKWDGKNPEIRTFLKHEYGGRCQICSSSFTQRNGDAYFEGVYMISHTTGAWLDRPGSVLCLCPTCCAKILYGSVSVVGDIVQQVLDYRLKNEDGVSNFEMPIVLCGREDRLQFSEKHILDLQEILKIDE